jgi:hypothetical protein
MKTIKTIDLALQITFVLVLLLMIIPTGEYSDRYAYAMIGYAVFGAYQVLSAALTRLFSLYIKPHRFRLYYEITLGILLPTFIIGTFYDFYAVYRYVGFFIALLSPFLAILYGTICYLEIKAYSIDETKA